MNDSTNREGRPDGSALAFALQFYEDTLPASEPFAPLAELARSLPHNLLGVTEIAARLGVQPNTVTVWRRRHPTFPQPLVVLSMGPIWWASDVDAWQEGRQR